MKTRQIFSTAEIQLGRVCDQMQLLQHEIKGLKVRHERATQQQQLGMMQQTELQLDILKETYKMYYSAAERITMKMEELAQIQTS